jgi:hypothetical protein
MTSDIEASATYQDRCRLERFAGAARRPLDGKDVHAVYLFAASPDRG